MRGAYYNEIDCFAAAWLRELIGAGLLADGEVDDRSIVDVRPEDLWSYRECHFFAGIGGWPYALALAGWREDWEVWTGSCPCQPLSVAGQGRGHADKRHLWPAFHALIVERRPAVVFGEQVAGKAGLEWLAGVRADLEASGYACGAAIMPACAVGAPHRRERLFWVADAAGERERANELGQDCRDGQFMAWAGTRRDGGDDGGAGFWSGAEWLAGADGKTRRVKPGVRLLVDGVPNRVGRLRGYGNAIVPQVAAEFVKAFMEARASA
jgi:DNA (cytosine-5)-methyltransferase 1